MMKRNLKSTNLHIYYGIINKSELKEYEEDFGEDITDLCDFLIHFD